MTTISLFDYASCLRVLTIFQPEITNERKTEML